MMFQQPPPQGLKFAPKPATSSTVQPATTSESHVQDDKGFRQPITFDGKRMRKAVMRKTVDYNSSVVKQIEVRCPLVPGLYPKRRLRSDMAINSFRRFFLSVTKSQFSPRALLLLTKRVLK